MKKIWLKIARSFKEMEQFDRDYYFSMSAKERVETMQLLREMYCMIKKGAKHAGRERLRRVIKKGNLSDLIG